MKTAATIPSARNAVPARNNRCATQIKSALPPCSDLSRWYTEGAISGTVVLRSLRSGASNARQSKRDQSNRAEDSRANHVHKLPPVSQYGCGLRL
jgi:hypothetical protein